MTDFDGKERLLEREDPTTTDPLDAHHWIAIYGELLTFKRRLIDRARDALADLSPTARPAGEVDLQFLEAQRARFEARRAFWLQRQRDLRGLHIDHSTRMLAYQGHLVPLTGRELQLLECLLAFDGTPVAAQRLIAEAWHDPSLTSEQLRLYITRLRSKLAPLNGIEIRHEPRRGYALLFTVAAPPRHRRRKASGRAKNVVDIDGHVRDRLTTDGDRDGEVEAADGAA